MLFLCVGVGVALTIGAFVLVARRSRRRRTASGQIFQVRRQSRSAAPSLGPLSPTFDPFIPHLVHVAQATGQKIVCADGIGGSVLGVGIDDAPAQLATIFAKDSDVCEAIRKELGRTEFFSDTRHPRLASVAKTSNPGPAEAYNVYETYELLELTARPDDLGYDGDVVDPLKPADVAEAGALLDAVYGVPCKAWLEASIAAGDLAWVAREGGRIVGVAMASLVGDHARLHALTVSAAHRGRGLGTALYRARLRGLFDLGAARVLTECATWNLGALDLAREHGFVKIGMMYVESARSERQERKFLRR